MILFGGGGLAMELLAWFGDTLDRRDDELVVVDEGRPRIADIERLLGRSVVWSHDLTSVARPGDAFVLGLGDPVVRHARRQLCLDAGLLPRTLVHPSAVVCAGATLGEGSIVGPLCYVGPFARLGDGSLMNVQSCLGHDAESGTSSVISPLAFLGGNSGCGAQSLVGGSSTILPGKRLGAWSKLAAGAVLHDDTPDGSLARGSPAVHRIMFRNPDES